MLTKKKKKLFNICLYRIILFEIGLKIPSKKIVIMSLITTIKIKLLHRLMKNRENTWQKGRLYNNMYKRVKIYIGL